MDEEAQRRRVAQRLANERAAARGEPLPFPNPFDLLDSTKVAADATPEERAASVREFRRRCRMPKPRKHSI